MSIISIQSVLQVVESFKALALQDALAGIVAYQYERKNQNHDDSALEDPCAVHQSGLTRQENLEHYLKSKNPKDLKPVRSADGRGRLIWVRPDFIELHAELGYPRAIDAYEKRSGHSDFEVRPSFEQLAQNDPAIAQLVPVYDFPGSHHLCDVQGNPLPSPLYFGYIASGIDNSNYELEPLVQHLWHHPWVSIPENKSDRADSAILDIPYYNVELGRTQYVQFIAKLPADVYSPIAKRCNLSADGIRAEVLKLDLLDMAQFKRKESSSQ